MDEPKNVYQKNSPPEAETEPTLEHVLILMRLLVGGTLEGIDEVIRRLKERQVTLSPNQAEKMTVVLYDETELDRLRHALVGLLFQTPGAALKGLSTIGETTGKASRLVSRLVSPVTNSRLFRPVQRRIDTLTERRQAMIRQLIQIGRAEEFHGRLLARNTAVEIIDELMAYLAEKPELRRLVQQQSKGLADEVVGEIRHRTASADHLLDRMTSTLLRRSPPPPAPPVVELPANAKSEDNT